MRPHALENEAAGASMVDIWDLEKEYARRKAAVLGKYRREKNE
jgi:hypothetical protein